MLAKRFEPLCKQLYTLSARTTYRTNQFGPGVQ
jgi:hypothetical protein